MLAASLYFYAASAVWFLLPLLFTSLLDYFLGKKIYDSSNENHRKNLLIASVVFNLGFLGFFKYANWISTELAALFAFCGITLSTISVPLPGGISFYTFQSMSYTIDIFKKEFKPQRSCINYLDFVCFFPQLVAGPIMRAKELLNQLAAYREFPSQSQISTALFMILFGLFQKVVVADNVGAIVETINKLINPSGPKLAPGLGLIFAYGFAFQIYCDFSAYSTIARGSALLFNVNVPHNFLTPYFSANPSEFWRRWHISLSTWLRDYLYIPLGGNRYGERQTNRNLLITMFLGGIWHGAGLFFALWGVYHGLLLILYRKFPIDAKLIKIFGEKAGKFFAILLMFHLVCFGWILFRASPKQFIPICSSIVSVPSAIISHIHNYNEYFQKSDLLSIGFLKTCYGVFTGWFTANWYLTVYGWGLILFSASIIIFDYFAWKKNQEFPDLFNLIPLPAKVFVLIFLIYGLQFFGKREANEFIYFAF
jgi:D-alanyl-lipoteichoic acid acyltransferase DltB (MBOAT superfamily)